MLWAILIIQVVGFVLVFLAIRFYSRTVEDMTSRLFDILEEHGDYIKKHEELIAELRDNDGESWKRGGGLGI